MRIVRLKLTAPPGTTPTQADAQLLHDELWAYTGPDAQIAHITATAIPAGIDITLFLSSQVNDPERHVVSVLSSISRKSPTLSHWLRNLE